MLKMAARFANRIYIRNLPWTIGKRELKEYFSQFGFVTQSVVLFNKETGMSKQYGFVSYATKDGLVNAIREPRQHLEGGYIYVQPAN